MGRASGREVSSLGSRLCPVEGRVSHTRRMTERRLWTSGATPPRLVLADGAAEALKWLAVLLMTGDHVNKYLFNGTLPVLFEAGRLALPIFVIVLAYNLSRPGRLDNGTYTRTMTRTALFGLLASVPFIALGGLYAGWWPLNILFTLLLLTAMLYLIERRNFVCAGGIFVIGGSLVEFWWPALLLGLAVWFYCRRPAWITALCAVLALAALWLINGNFWAMTALPLVLVLAHLDLPMPRLKWAFYIYYPLHLSLLWLIRIPMRDAGFVFFT